MSVVVVRLDYLVNGVPIHQEIRLAREGLMVSLAGSNPGRAEVHLTVLRVTDDGPRMVPECVACPHCGGYVRGHLWISANACSVSQIPRKELGMMPETPCRKAPECGVWWHVPFTPPPRKQETTSNGTD